MYSVLEYLEQSAAQFGNKRAVAYKEDVYTFNELMHLAKRIGASLKGKIQSNSPVAVIAERGIECIAQFLGVLYAGCYYVPIDPDMPTEKQQAILDDARITIVLGLEVHRPLIEKLKLNGTFISLNNIGEEECDIPDCGGDDPLYMVYTSGSTGKPKGVLKSHKAEISFIEAYCETFGFTSEEVIGNQTPFFFDASAKDLYMMLKLGCTIEILPSSLFSLPPELIDYLNQKQVTFASWVPTVLSIVAQLNPFSMVVPETLKRVFFVGEVMPMKHLNKWREALPHLEYVNLYGQSEIAGICSYYRVTGTFENSATLPMGKPLGNCKIYLVDNESIVTEPGKIGEMYLVSDALATEYYNDEAKTSASFIMKDFGEGPVRCFKTGDLAQYDTDGNLLFAARNDFQIKHMGHRIELGEIETIAGALAEIDRCCCLYHQEKRKIVLFCQLSSGASVTGREIQSELRQKLSAYMLPGKVIVKEKLPVNANGKIDRQALKKELIEGKTK